MVLAVSLMLLALGLFMYWVSVKMLGLKRRIQQTPTVKAVAVAPGIVEVSGKASVFRQIFKSPFEQKDCLFYVTEVYAWFGSKDSERRLIKSICSKDPILLQDETGSVLIQPTITSISVKAANQLDVDIKESTLISISPGELIVNKEKLKISPLKQFLRKEFLNIYAPEYANYHDTIEVEETYIQAGDPVFCIGTASEYDHNDGLPLMIIKDDSSRGVFLIADGDEKSALSELSLPAYPGLFGGPILIFFAFLLMNIGLLIPLLAAASMYAWLVIGGVISLYNGLILLHNATDRARANIAVMSQKKASLIPLLVDIVKTYASHEKKLQVELAEMQSRGIDGKLIMAIAEAYPELNAGEQFRYLSKQLITVENQIAWSKKYYNDTVELYNASIKRFPDIFLAKVANLKHDEYL